MVKLDTARTMVQADIDSVMEAIQQDEHDIREYASRAKCNDLATTLPIYCKRLEDDIQRLQQYREQLKILSSIESE